MDQLARDYDDAISKLKASLTTEALQPEEKYDFEQLVGLYEERKAACERASAALANLPPPSPFISQEEEDAIRMLAVKDKYQVAQREASNLAATPAAARRCQWGQLRSFYMEIVRTILRRGSVRCGSGGGSSPFRKACQEARRGPPSPRGLAALERAVRGDELASPAADLVAGGTLAGVSSVVGVDGVRGGRGAAAAATSVASASRHKANMQTVRRVPLGELVERVEHELRARGRAGRVDQHVARHAVAQQQVARTALLEKARRLSGRTRRCGRGRRHHLTFCVLPRGSSSSSVSSALGSSVATLRAISPNQGSAFATMVRARDAPPAAYRAAYLAKVRRWGSRASRCAGRRRCPT